MSSVRRRFHIWAMVLLAFALVAAAIWSVSADKRGRWLRQAAWTNKTDRAKLLVWLGTDVNFATGGGTALHGAAYTGNAELIHFLIQHGATIDYAAKWDITPLWQARTNHQAEAERLLLGYGANPDTSRINPP